MKKAYTLVITLILITLFASLANSILEIKSIEKESIEKEFLYLQAKNHMSFLEELIKDEDLNTLETFTIEDEDFLIEARKKDLSSKNILLSVKAYNSPIRVTKELTIK